MIEPLGKEVLIKGIQSHDKDIEDAEAGTRVGLNLKGIEADEIKRGYVVCKSIEKSSDIKLKFSRSKFFRQELKAGMNVLLSVGLQVIACNVESIGDELVLKSQQKIAYQKNQHCIVASQNEILPRIIGSGNII
jgi:selenocysteine-specific translation elongation factor